MRKSSFIKLVVLSSLLVTAIPVYSQNGLAVITTMQGFIYGAIVFVILAIVATVYFVSQISKYQYEANVKAGKPGAATGLRKWWSDLDKKYFTKAASAEQEADVLLDHDYDGIKELDNALPPWWKYGFYITVVVAVFYLLRFHIWKTGPSPLDEYNNEMQIAATQLENYRKNHQEAVDEKTVNMADAKGVDAGKAIFTKTCTPCHGGNGEGNMVGPNLTDKYWLHGGSISNVFHTITFGVPEKGMQSWGKVFSSGDIKNLASFVLSLQGSNPPNAKAPQGNEYIPDSARTDSTAVKKDSAASKTIATR
jgi:cytochrome c oxidase cbb3-type subunit 3